MNGNYTWIKLYGEILHDRKMAKLSDRLWRRAVEIMLLAGQEADEGILPHLADMAWDLRCEEEELEAELLALSESIGLRYDEEIERWVLIHFSDRQAALTSTERSRKSRGSNSSNVSGYTYSGEEASDEENYATKTLHKRLKVCNENVAGDATKTLQERPIVCNESVPEEEEIRREVEEEEIRSRSSPARALHGGISPQGGSKEDKIKSRPARALHGGLSAGARKNTREMSPARGDAAAAAVKINLKPPDNNFENKYPPSQRTLDFYGANIGKLNQYSREWLARQTNKYGDPTVMKALEEGLRFGVQNHRYLEAILTRWETEGLPGEDKVQNRQPYRRNTIQDELAAFLASE